MVGRWLSFWDDVYVQGRPVKLPGGKKKHHHFKKNKTSCQHLHHQYCQRLWLVHTHPLHVFDHFDRGLWNGHLQHHQHPGHSVHPGGMHKSENVRGKSRIHWVYGLLFSVCLLYIYILKYTINIFQLSMYVIVFISLSPSLVISTPPPIALI